MQLRNVMNVIKATFWTIIREWEPERLRACVGGCVYVWIMLGGGGRGGSQGPDFQGDDGIGEK